MTDSEKLLCAVVHALLAKGVITTRDIEAYTPRNETPEADAK